MILLSFDIEEFDLPTEYGLAISWEEQLRVSREGSGHILNVLARHGVRATFFCTARFAEAAPDVLRAICDGGHEVASHGYAHSTFEEADLTRSREILRRMSGQPVTGFRMPRMMHVADKALLRAGYRYNSSLNPTLIPGRYNHLNQPRIWFRREGLLQLPASTTPRVRFPLLWLSFQHLPPARYRRLARLPLCCRRVGLLQLPAPTSRPVRYPSCGRSCTHCPPRSTAAWPASPCATTATYSSTSTLGSSCPCKAYRGCRDSSRVTVAPQPWSASIS